MAEHEGGLSDKVIQCRLFAYQDLGGGEGSEDVFPPQIRSRSCQGQLYVAQFHGSGKDGASAKVGDMKLTHVISTKKSAHFGSIIEGEEMQKFINKIICGDALELARRLPDECIDTIITSPPYYSLRDYGIDGQLGLEKTPEEYVAKLTILFTEIKRVLKPKGTLWLNLGDSYNGSGGTGWTGLESKNWKQKSQPRHLKHSEIKPKDLIGIPWMVAFALRADGWYLRQDIIWHKPNPMPESVTDRCTKSHEYIFLLSKENRYYFDYESIQEIATGFDGRKDTMMKGSEKYKNSVIPGQEEHTMASQGHERWKFKGTGTFGNRDGELDGLHSGNKYNPKFKNLQPNGQQPNTMHIKRAEGEADEVYPIRNKRSVWTVNTKPYADAHFATFPEKLITDCILAGSPEGGIILDPFMGAGTTAVVAKKLNRNFIGFDLNPKYCKLAEKRIRQELGLFAPGLDVK